MEKTGIEIQGYIYKKGGEAFTKEAFFDLLIEAGFVLEGSVRHVEEAKLDEAVQSIVHTLGPEKVQRMLAFLEERYECTELDDIEQFLFNTGTGAFDEFVYKHLDEKEIEAYREYSERTWQVSDVFEARLANEILQIIKSSR